MIQISCYTPRHHSGYESPKPQLPDDFVELYHNPFCPTAQVVAAGPLEQPNQFTIYNVLGEEVACVENIIATEHKNYVISEGYCAVENDDGNVNTVKYNLGLDTLETGVYFYKLETPKFSDAKKMVLLK